MFQHSEGIRGGIWMEARCMLMAVWVKGLTWGSTAAGDDQLTPPSCPPHPHRPDSSATTCWVTVLCWEAVQKETVWFWLVWKSCVIPEVSSATGGAALADPCCAIPIFQPVPEDVKFCPKKHAVLFQEPLRSKQVINAILAALPSMLESVLENSIGTENNFTWILCL